MQLEAQLAEIFLQQVQIQVIHAPMPNAQVLASDIPSPTSHDNSRTDNILLQCHGPCTSIEKTFDHQDKLELHMKFYHASE